MSFVISPAILVFCWCNYYSFFFFRIDSFIFHLLSPVLFLRIYGNYIRIYTFIFGICFTGWLLLFPRIFYEIMFRIVIICNVIKIPSLILYLVHIQIWTVLPLQLTWAPTAYKAIASFLSPQNIYAINIDNNCDKKQLTLTPFWKGTATLMANIALVFNLRFHRIWG